MLTNETKLPNGAEEIARRSREGRKGDVILCRLPYNEVTPWVTWVHGGSENGCYWGHYFRDENEARADYLTR